MQEFLRLKRLPPYVFNITGEMKAAARARGEDIIDFGMGNPDGATPKHIVDKMIEAAGKTATHRYSLSKGIPRLRKAICNWYLKRYGVELDPLTEAIVTIGSKEGIAHLCLATLDRGDVVAVPSPSYPIHIFGPVIAGANVRGIPVHSTDDFLAELEQSVPLLDQVVALPPPAVGLEHVCEHLLVAQQPADVLVGGRLIQAAVNRDLCQPANECLFSIRNRSAAICQELSGPGEAG